MSGGTLLALASDEILMDPNAVLGPVDPQLGSFPAAGIVELMKRKTMGDPLDGSHDIGPQARHDLRDDLHRQVCESIAQGARCLLGGEVPDDAGAYYPPTVLTDVREGMPAYDEELFGPRREPAEDRLRSARPGGRDRCPREMILAVSRFRVANGMEAEVRRAFRRRPRRVDRVVGFQGMEVFTSADDPAVFHLVTRWVDEECFRAWHNSDEHNASHELIPNGLKLDGERRGESQP